MRPSAVDGKEVEDAEANATHDSVDQHEHGQGVLVLGEVDGGSVDEAAEEDLLARRHPRLLQKSSQLHGD